MNVRTAGLDIRDTVTGIASPLSPDLATVAHRVMQEMLYDNAIKHGAPGSPVYVRRNWTDGLSIEVSNACRADGPNGTAGGRGLAGMRQRLAAAGGTLTISRDQRAFTARAWLLLPGAGGGSLEALPARRRAAGAG